MAKEIILGEDQLNALDSVSKFLDSKNSDDVAMSIIGYAGTGKTTMIKEIIKLLRKKHIWTYQLCVPTHKAKLVLQSFSGETAVTIHKLLSLSPNLELKDLDFKDLRFYGGFEVPLFPIGGVVIIDEASMVNDVLCDLLIKNCKELNTKLIAIGDIAQLKPVNSTNTSKIFNYKPVVLSKIYRQSSESGLVTVLPTLRNKNISIFKEAIGSEGSLYVYTKPVDFFEKAIPEFKKSLKDKNVLHSKFLTYTNARSEAFNNKINEILFKNQDQYNQFSFLTCTENLEQNGFNFYNSSDYIILDKPKLTKVSIPGFIKLPAFELELYDPTDDISETILILDKETNPEYIRSLSSYIEDVRLSAIELKGRSQYASKEKWRLYYSIIGSFTTPFNLYYDNRLIRQRSFTKGYSSTVHKSQGSSINNVFIDMKNIKQCRDPLELRQLQYVAVSRTVQNAHILQ